MAIYFLRHGQSEANLNRVFAGQKNDAPLTEFGVQQVQAVAEALKTADIKRIYSSRLKRAYQTAEEVARVIGIDKIIIDDRLSEYDMGNLTAVPISKVTSEQLVAGEGAQDPGGFRDQVLDFFKQHKDDKDNILVVSHGGVGRVLEAARQGLEPKYFYDLPLYPNAHAVKLKLDWLQ